VREYYNLEELWGEPRRAKRTRARTKPAEQATL
jgi:hypothetical protein